MSSPKIDTMVKTLRSQRYAAARIHCDPLEGSRFHKLRQHDHSFEVVATISWFLARRAGFTPSEIVEGNLAIAPCP